MKPCVVHSWKEALSSQIKGWRNFIPISRISFISHVSHIPISLLPPFSWAEEEEMHQEGRKIVKNFLSWHCIRIQESVALERKLPLSSAWCSIFCPMVIQCLQSLYSCWINNGQHQWSRPVGGTFVLSPCTQSCGPSPGQQLLRANNSAHSNNCLCEERQLI